MNKFEEVIQCFEKVIEINPKKLAVFSLKSLNLFELKRYEEALPCFNKVIKNSENTYMLAMIKQTNDLNRYKWICYR